MFCQNCGKQVAEQAVTCIGCGCPPRAPGRFCWSCGAEHLPQAVMCVKCGVSLTGTTANASVAGAGVGGIAPRVQCRSRTTAGLLNLLLPLVLVGGVGRLYLGYTGIGVAQLIVGILTCDIGGIWSIVDGILILMGRVKTDAKGNPLV